MRLSSRFFTLCALLHLENDGGDVSESWERLNSHKTSHKNLAINANGAASGLKGQMALVSLEQHEDDQLLSILQHPLLIARIELTILWFDWACVENGNW